MHARHTLRIIVALCLPLPALAGVTNITHAGFYPTMVDAGATIISVPWPEMFSNPGSVIDITNAAVQLTDLKLTDGGAAMTGGAFVAYRSGGSAGVMFTRRN